MTTKHKGSILIVDDNFNQCQTLASILRHKGYAVATAADGAVAIDKVQEEPFDMIFVDIKMPFMNGVEAYRQIKAIRPEAMVVMMTAYAMEELVQQALQEGACGIVYKPLDIDHAIAIIEEAKQHRKGALVLVVDDDPGTCDTLSKILTRKSYRVRTAQTGEAAITMTREKPIDILLVDVKLPVLNGLETYLAIREINPQVVAIMMTAYRQEMAALVDEAMHNHVYACLFKPLDIEDLLKLLAEVQQKRRMASSG